MGGLYRAANRFARVVGQLGAEHQVTDLVQQTGDKQAVAALEVQIKRHLLGQNAGIQTVMPERFERQNVVRQLEARHRARAQHQVMQLIDADHVDRARNTVDRLGKTEIGAIDQPQHPRRQIRIDDDQFGEVVDFGVFVLDQPPDLEINFRQRDQPGNFLDFLFDIWHGCSTGLIVSDLAESLIDAAIRLACNCSQIASYPLNSQNRRVAG